MDILLVGTYTQHDAPAVLEKQELGKGIYLIPYNEILGDVAGTPLIIQMQNPSWVCLVKNRLFAVSESEDAAEIVEYEVGVQEERLTAEKKAGLQMPGKASCHIEKDEKGQRLFVSDYGSGDLKVIDISEAGSPKLLQEISFTGKGLDPERQEASHIHSCFLHRGDLYAADLGCDKIYSFGTDKGKLLQKETIEVRPGAGPRHMEILDKNGKTYLYVLNELDLTISVYCNGELCQTISLEEELPEGALAAELCIAEEKMLYASVRGTGEIFGFTIDENGMLNLKQKVVVPKGWFRSICLDSSEKHLLAADQKTGKIYIFDRQSTVMRKKAIVTGASRGIGRGIIRELAAAGYDIAFSYRTREDEAKEAAEEIRNMGSFAWYAKADMAQAGEGENFFDQAVKELGGLDLLVNNAGVTVFQSILDLEMEETQKMLNLDLLNYLVLSSKAARYMKAHEVKGCIINITSSRAERAYPGDCVYGGIKAAVNRASQSMALDLAPYGIRVNCVAPGAICIRTPEEIKAEGRTELEGFWESLGERIPMGRNGTPKDIGRAVVFLASENAAYITGEVLRVDGGLILPGMPEKVENDKNAWGGEK